MKTLILGGMRSGKSRHAISLVNAQQKPVIFIATATGEDEEMVARIARHRSERPAHWRLVEEPVELSRALDAASQAHNIVIVDCLTLWSSNLLHQQRPLTAARQDFLSALAVAPGDIVLVSNEVGMGIIPMEALSRQFCDEMGRLHQDLAAMCDGVVLMVAGLPLWVKKPQ